MPFTNISQGIHQRGQHVLFVSLWNSGVVQQFYISETVLQIYVHIQMISVFSQSFVFRFFFFFFWLTFRPLTVNSTYEKTCFLCLSVYSVLPCSVNTSMESYLTLFVVCPRWNFSGATEDCDCRFSYRQTSFGYKQGNVGWHFHALNPALIYLHCGFMTLWNMWTHTH